MSHLLKIIAVLIVLSVVGAASYLAYDIFWKKNPPPPKPEPTLAATPQNPLQSILELAQTKAATGEINEAKSILESALPDLDQSPLSQNILNFLGKLNAASLLSPSPAPGKSTYVVVQGDSISRIASRSKINPDLIVFINNLPNHNLKIGQNLLIPELSLSISLDSKARQLTLLNNNIFFKSYPLIDIPSTVPSGNATVTDRLALLDGKRIAFGEKNYQAAQKIILLSAGGLSIKANDSSPQNSFSLSPPDMAEVFMLIRPGTPVTFHTNK